MSYCRFGPNSDVYMYESIYGAFQIHVKSKFKDYSCTNRKEALEILNNLSYEGYKIPQEAFDRLKKEIELNLPDPKWDGETL